MPASWITISNGPEVGREPGGRPVTVHLKKLCVGVDRVDELMEWQAGRLAAGGGARDALYHQTRNHPKRAAEILDGGSLYWVIRGVMRIRQRIIGIEDGPMPDLDEAVVRRRRPPCRLILDPELVPVLPRAHRPFQGWRYLETEDAPPDLGARAQTGGMPPEMAAELRELGLI